MKYLITFLTFLGCLAGGRSLAEVVPVWSTGVAVPGEAVILYLVDTESDSEASFVLAERPKVSHASLNDDIAVQHTIPNRMDPQQKVLSIKPLIITPDRPGKVEVEDIRLEYPDGREQTLKVPALPVADTSKIVWHERPYPYGALWYTEEKDGYIYQPVKAQLKVFLPQDGVRYSDILQLDTMGVSASTFMMTELGPLKIFHQQLANLLYQRGVPILTATARNQRWTTLDFEGELTPLREGNVGTKAVLETELGRGFLREKCPLELPAVSLSALPLPPDAPADFADTVGQYSIEATSDAKSLAMHEVVDVTITVRGTGNFNNIECPKPVDAEGWKLVPATRKPLTDINGKTVGVVFSQLMRPTAELAAIPAFAFSYFDPEAMEYRRAETRPIPLTWRVTEDAGSGLQGVAAEPPPAGEVPVEEMVDIYGYVPDSQWHALQLPRWLWYLLYLPALAILGSMGLRALRARLAAGASGRARERELSRIAREGTGLGFLKSLGGFIESNVPAEERTPELQQILARRDAEAFRPGAQVELAPEERQGMLRQVRRALAKVATTAALLLLALAPATWAASEGGDMQAAYEKGQFSQAREGLESALKATPDAAGRAQLLYNLGNCFYRLDQPGQAALCYARALQLNPGFKEARANLAFVQRKCGAITRTARGADSVFTFFSPQQLWILTIVATAALALCIVLQLTRRGSQRPWLHTCTALALLLSLAACANWVYYLTRDTPDFNLLPPENIAYVVAADTARSAADEQGASVIRVTPASPVLLLAERGSWCYIETAMGTRGWVHSASLAPLAEEGMAPRMPLSITF